MLSVMTKCLISETCYQRLTDPNLCDNYEFGDFMRRSRAFYENALAR